MNCGLAYKCEMCLILVCPKVLGWGKNGPCWVAVVNLFSAYGYLMLLTEELYHVTLRVKLA